MRVIAVFAALFGHLLQDEKVAPRDPVDLRCGAYCVYSVLKGLGIPVSEFKEFEKKLGEPSIRGYSLQQLSEAAKDSGASAKPINADDPKYIYNVPRPFGCVALLKSGHFVGVYDVAADEVSVIDPPFSYEMRKDLFEKLWTGDALLIFPGDAPEFPPHAESSWSRGGAIVVAIVSLLVLVGAFSIHQLRHKYRRSLA